MVTESYNGICVISDREAGKRFEELLLRSLEMKAPDLSEAERSIERGKKFLETWSFDE